MKKARIVVLSAFTCVLIVASTTASIAGHATGMELFYRWQQDSTYEITAIFYRNCQGSTSSAPSNLPIRIFSPSLGTSFSTGYTNIVLPPLPTTGPGVPLLNLQHPFDCIGGNYCLEEYVYRGTWTSPQKSKDWIFATQICCIPNVYNMTYSDMFAEAGLNNLNFPDSIYRTNSPIFHNRRPNHPGHSGDVIDNPAVYATCAWKPVELSQSVRNYDSDEIRYSFFIPQTTDGVANTYINGFTFTDPLPTLSGISIDSITGLISFTPDTNASPQMYLLGVQATAYKYDTVLISGVLTPVRRQSSYIRRNLTVIVEDTSACMQQAPFVFTDTNGINEIDTLKLGCSEKQFRLQFEPRYLRESIDSNASHVVLVNTATLDTVHIIHTIADTFAMNETTDNFMVYLDAVLNPGIYHLYFTSGSDGNTMISSCGDTLGIKADTLTIQVFEEKGSGYLVRDLNSDTSDTLEIACGAQHFEFWLTEKFRCGMGNTEEYFKMYRITDTGEAVYHLANIYAHCQDGYGQRLVVNNGKYLEPGFYRLVLKDDQYKIRGYCNNIFDTSQLIIRVNFKELDLGPDIVFCEGIWDTTLYITEPGFRNLWWYSDRYPISVGTGNSHRIIYPAEWWVEGYYGNSRSFCRVEDHIFITEKPCPVGIDENPGKLNVTLYPNPTTEYLNIEIQNLAGKTEMKIYDIRGRIIKINSLKPGVNRIDIGELNYGIYLIKLISNEEVVFQQKFLKDWSK